MQCPQCHGDYEPIDLKTITGSIVDSRRCTQCGGFWFARPLTEPFAPESIAQYDRPVPNYSLRNLDLTCPNDESLMTQVDNDSAIAGVKSWTCPDCDGVFFPKGQLAMYSKWEQDQVSTGAIPGNFSRVQAAGSVSLMAILAISIFGSIGRVGTYQAASNSTLPTSGPNVFTLILLAVTYLAGTVLAVLGRRLVLIIIGWSVIVICLVGFAVIIFGP